MRKLIPLALAILVLAARAEAQEEQPEGDEIARRTFEAGRAAFAAGDYEAALAHFREAYELSGRHGLLYNIAQSLDRLRRDEETIAAFREYLERVPNSRSRAEVEARIRVLERIVEDRRAQEEARRAAEEAAARARAEREADERQPDEREREPVVAQAPSRPPLHVAIFITTGVLAVGGGGVAIWTGLETLRLNDAYRAETDYDAAAAFYGEGNDYQTATNVLIFSSAGLAALAVVLAIFTDFGGGEAAPAASAWLPWLDVGSDRAVVGGTLSF